MPGDLDGGIESRGGRVELAQLQLDAFADRARAYTRRIERLYARQRGFDLGGAAFDLGAQRIRDLFERLGDIAVVTDGVDDRARDGELAGLESRDLELPQK